MPCILEDALDGGAPEVEAQVPERAAKPRVSPRRIFSGHRQKLLHLLTAVRSRARSAPRTTPVVLRGDALAVPPEDGLRRRERRHLGQQTAPERLSRFGEKPALGVREPKTPRTESRPQHAVLDAQKLERFTLSATDPASDEKNEELKRNGGRHGRRTLPTQALTANAFRPECRAIEFGTVRPRMQCPGMWVHV